MKKLTFLIVLSLLIKVNLWSQPCLPDGIIFNTQEQIDNFQINYPNCTDIEGDVIISGSGISNLNGLSMLISIGGDLKIISNNVLINLTGLNNLISIAADLKIYGNDLLTSLTGLFNLTFVGGDLIIGFHFWPPGPVGNPFLTSLAGLENLSAIGGNLSIDCNPVLVSLAGLGGLNTIGGYCNISSNMTNLTGLEELLTVGGDFRISGSVNLTDLTGLENVISIGGLMIEYNPSLISLSGLENLNPGSIEDIFICNNSSLSSCELQCICEYLAYPSGTVNIYNNANGCNNPSEVADACSVSLPCLPFGNFHFFNQNDINDFQTNYSGCTELEGDVLIDGDNITNLNGLSVLTSIDSNLNISSCNTLANLSGLEGLTTVGGDLFICYNHSLTSLSGLESLTSVGGRFFMKNNNELSNMAGLNNLDSIAGKFFIAENEALIDLYGIESLTSIGGQFLIQDNNALTTLTGVENLTNIIGELKINYNSALNSIIGLHNLDFIGENCILSNNNVLMNLTGLDNLNIIGGYLNIENNDGLLSLLGLENVTSVGGTLAIKGNNALTSLSGLDSLMSIGGNLNIGGDWTGYGNPALASLAGLNNIEAASIDNLLIANNTSLSTCEVQNICDYLISPNGIIEIHNNAPGCNSPEEVEEGCFTNTTEFLDVGIEMQIYPNPANDKLYLLNKDDTSIVEINIYNQIGQKVIHQTGFENSIDVIGLPLGMYIIEIITSELKIRKKLIIQ